MIINLRQAETLVEILENEAPPDEYVTITNDLPQHNIDDVLVLTGISVRVINQNGEQRETIR